MEIRGKIIAVLPAKSGVSAKSGNQWASQSYVIEFSSGEYVKKMVFDVFGDDRISQFAIKNGDDVTVHFDIDAHEYIGKWYNSMRAYNVEKHQQVQQTVIYPNQPAPQPQYQPPVTDNSSDLPF